MIWEWMGLCKSTLRSIPSCLFGTKRGYSCFHPITVKKKNSTSNYIFVIESLVPNQMPILEVFFDWRKRWAFLIPCPPAVSSWSVKTQLTQASRCKSEIRANLGEISEQSCFTRYVLQWNSLFIFISLMTLFFVTPTLSLVLLLLFDYAARTRRSNGSFKWTDTLGHRKYHWHINHCSYKTKAKHTTYIAEETIRSRGSDKTELQRVHFSALNRVLG